MVARAWAKCLAKHGREHPTTGCGLFRGVPGLVGAGIRTFGLAAHTIAAVMLTAVHNLHQIQRTKTTDDTTPSSAPTSSSDAEAPTTDSDDGRTKPGLTV